MPFLLEHKAMTVFAFDPGKTTGIATFDVLTREFHQWEMEGRSKIYPLIDTLTCHDFCVVERYTITGMTAKYSQQLDALYIIGALEAHAQTYGAGFALQSPSQAKSFGTDAKLKHLGWWYQTAGGHANDAARHLLRHMIIERQDVVLTNKLAEIL
jgi:hypothetical protein